MSRTGREALIAAFLAEAGEQLSSGEILCGKLGLSRAELFAGIEDLRARGFAIESAPGGYRLLSVPDRLAADALEPLLTTRELGRALVFLDETSSTSDVAHRMACDGAPHGQLVVAEAQTRGRGRHGRSWISPKGVNLYLSLVLRPSLSPSRAPELGLVVAVALAEALLELGAPVRIKWPNDLEIGAKKVAGVLAEMSAEPERLHFVVVGIGINVNLDPIPSEIDSIATSLKRELGRGVSRLRLCAAVLSSLEDWLDRHEDQGFSPVRSRWMELSSTVGSMVEVHLEGGRVLAGEAQGIDDGGALLVRAASGLERVLSGDVRALRPRVA